MEVLFGEGLRASSDAQADAKADAEANAGANSNPHPDAESHPVACASEESGSRADAYAKSDCRDYADIASRRGKPERRSRCGGR